MRLLGDQVDLRQGVTAAHVVGGGHAGDAVAQDDDAFDRAIEVERRDPRERGPLRLLRCQGRCHRSLHASAAGHAGVVGKPEAVERRSLVVGDPRKILHALLYAHRVRATNAHPAAGLDRQAAGLGHLQQCHAGLGDHALALRLEAHFRSVGGQRAV
jgi:hypothetical protein